MRPRHIIKVNYNEIHFELEYSHIQLGTDSIDSTDCNIIFIRNWIVAVRTMECSWGCVMCYHLLEVI
jgi:hypothetical protein